MDYPRESQKISDEKNQHQWHLKKEKQSAMLNWDISHYLISSPLELSKGFHLGHWINSLIWKKRKATIKRQNTGFFISQSELNIIHETENRVTPPIGWTWCIMLTFEVISWPAFMFIAPVVNLFRFTVTGLLPWSEP